MEVGHGFLMFHFHDGGRVRVVEQKNLQLTLVDVALYWLVQFIGIFIMAYITIPTLLGCIHPPKMNMEPKNAPKKEKERKHLHTTNFYRLHITPLYTPNKQGPLVTAVTAIHLSWRTSECVPNRRQAKHTHCQPRWQPSEKSFRKPIGSMGRLYVYYVLTFPLRIHGAGIFPDMKTIKINQGR